MEYRRDITSCPATCSQPNAPMSCTKSRTKGCRCKPGLVLKDVENMECIRPRECKCVYGVHRFQVCTLKEIELYDTIQYLGYVELEFLGVFEKVPVLVFPLETNQIV